MSPIRYRDESPSFGGMLASITAGAIAGFAVGVVVAQKMGGLSGIASRISRRFPELDDGADLHHGYGEDELEEEHEVDGEALLEEDVLDAFENDPVLGERAIDIAAVGTGVIELSGWVRSEAESRRAETVARRVSGVQSVVNRLSSEDDVETHPLDIEGEEDGVDDTSEPRPGGQWEGQRVGMGKRRQGSSTEADRHSDPKPELEERWLDKEHALLDSAGDIESVTERRAKGRRGSAKGERTGRAAEAQGEVPRADNVAEPELSPPSQPVDQQES